LVALVWFFAVIQPNLESWLFEVNLQSAANVAPRGAYLLTKAFALGLSFEPDGSVGLGAFLRLSLLPVVLCLVWVLHSASRALRQGPLAVIRSWTFAELLAVTWAVTEFGLLSLTSSPDRRYLWVTVPCTILAAHALGHPPTTGRTVAEFTPESTERWRTCGLGVAVAVVFAVYLRAPLASAIAPLTQKVQLGFEAGLSLGTVCAILVFALCVLGALLGPAIARAMRQTGLRWGTIALGVALLAGGATGLRLAQEVTNRSYELHRISNEIRAIVGEDAAVAGGAVDTLLMGAPNRTLIIRDWGWLEFAVYGLEYLDEVSPSYFIMDEAFDRESASARTSRVLRGLRSAVPSSFRIIRGVHRMPGAEDQPLEFTLVRLSDGQ
jgi:hypothetical protein